MSRNIEQHVDTNAGKDMKNWKAGNELGLELKEEVEEKEPLSNSLSKEPSLPLFISDSPEGNKGNAQDEKDETEE